MTISEFTNAMNICTQIAVTSSLNEKTAIIQRNNCSELRDVLFFLLNPFILTGISSKKFKKIVEPYPIQTTGVSLDYFTTHNTGTDKDIAYVQEVYNMLGAGSPVAEFYFKLITKTLRLGCEAKLVNKALEDSFIPTWEVQQAYPITKYPIKEGTWFSLSLKLNGVRCTYVDNKFMSRQGQEINGLDHIAKDLAQLDLEDYIIDGEVIRNNLDNIPDNENFRLTTGLVNSDGVDKSELQYVIFDIVKKDEFALRVSKIAATYKTRKQWLEQAREKINNLGLKNIAIVPMFYEGTDQSEIDKWLQWANNNNKEGLMANLDTIYKCNRHRGILKVKTFYTLDLPIVDVVEGEGKYEGMLGRFDVDFKGTTVGVGSGFTDDQRKEYWTMGDALIGRIIEVKYKEISHNQNGSDSLQFPVFVALREKGKRANLEGV